MEYKGKFVRGDSMEEIIKSIDRTLTHFSRRLHKTVVIKQWKPNETKPDIEQLLINELDKVVDNHAREALQEAHSDSEQETKGIVWSGAGQEKGRGERKGSGDNEEGAQVSPEGVEGQEVTQD